MKTYDTIQLIEGLNAMLAREYACTIPFGVDSRFRRLQDMSSTEIAHAAKLRKRICALGGIPTIGVEGGGECGKTLEGLPRFDPLLPETLTDVVRNDQEYHDQLRDCAPVWEEDVPRKSLRLRPDPRTGGHNRAVEDSSPIDSED
jgi:bacterioferritin (cytochrome b1)